MGVVVVTRLGPERVIGLHKSITLSMEWMGLVGILKGFFAETNPLPLTVLLIKVGCALMQMMQTHPISEWQLLYRCLLLSLLFVLCSLCYI